MTHRTVHLGELVTIVGGGTPRRGEPSYWGSGVPWASVKDLVGLELSQTQESITKAGLAASAGSLVPAGSIIIATRMALGKAVINTVDMAINQDLKALTCAPNVESRYLLHFLVSQAARLEGMGKGATVKGITLDRLTQLQVRLPSLAEQRRIAAVLDKADGIRRKRRESLKLLDDFLRSAFLEMFGDPVRNERGWEVVGLEDVLNQPLRNGLSPSKGGSVVAQVLTLTAITGSRYEPTAVKTASFAHAAAPDQIAGPEDFLICRGNGNLRLMGRARFPRGVAANTVFPDTMIAARVDQSRVEPSYLEAVWGMPLVRRALERGARTTSGIHKVNQKVLMSTRFPLPAIEKQSRYAEVAERVEGLRGQLSDGAADNLFDSLAQRAFRDEL